MEKLTESEIQERLKQLNGWEYTDGAIETTFEFKILRRPFR